MDAHLQQELRLWMSFLEVQKKFLIQTFSDALRSTVSCFQDSEPGHESEDGEQRPSISPDCYFVLLLQIVFVVVDQQSVAFIYRDNR